MEGGLGDAVLDALAATGAFGPRAEARRHARCPVGDPQELRAWAGIDARAIAAAAREALGR